MSLAGVRTPDWMEGTDLSVTLDDEEPAEKRDFHYGGMYNRFFIRTDDWVLIGDNQGNERTLCNLREDPGEFENVVKDHPDVSRELYSTVLDAAGGPLPYYE
jgi:arylsulfatase A-like enzyme